MQEAYNQIVQTRKFDDGGGVTHFGAISLTQIPGDPDSIKGNKARGFIGPNLIKLEKKFPEMLKLMRLLILNLLKIMKIPILKKFLIFYHLNINWEELEFY